MVKKKWLELEYKLKPQNPTKKQYLFNFSWLFVDQIFKTLVGLFIGVLVARYLGPEKYGIITYGLTFIFFSSFLTDFGLKKILPRNLARNPERINLYLGTAYGLKVIASIIALIGINLTAFMLEENSLQLNVISILSIKVLFTFSSVTNAYHLSQVQSKYTVIASTTSLIITSLLNLIFIYLELSIVYFVITNTLQFCLTAIINFYFLNKNGIKLKNLKFNKSIAFELLKDSWAIGIASVFGLINAKVDIFMLGNMLGKEEVGLYQVSNVLNNSLSSVITIMIGSLLPYVVNLKEKNPKLYQRRHIQMLSLATWIGIVLGVLAILFGKQAIVFAYGESYAPAYAALVVNCWIILFRLKGNINSNIIFSENLQSKLLYFAIMNSIINVILNYIFIPKYGITAAAFTTLLSVFLAQNIFMLFFKETRFIGIRNWKSLNPILVTRFFIEYRQLKKGLNK